jgi:hypothetical protein
MDVNAAGLGKSGERGGTEESLGAVFCYPERKRGTVAQIGAHFRNAKRPTRESPDRPFLFEKKS